MFKKYGIILGLGRSGTNWLLDILDASFYTHCRSEPYGVDNSPYKTIPQIWDWTREFTHLDYSNNWDNIVSITSQSIGDRDHHFKYPKNYIYPLSRLLGFPYLMTRSKLRKYMSLIIPSFRNSEWKLPWWIGSQRKLEESYTIVKVNLDAFTISWLIENHPEIPIVHIVRHPGGRLNSWLKRLVTEYERNQELEKLNIQGKRRLGNIAKYDPLWRDSLKDVENMDRITQEVWYWRYINETIYKVAKDAPNYKLLIYENLSNDPLGNAKEVYQHFGLPWDQNVQVLIERDLGMSVWGEIEGSSKDVSEAWKSNLSDNHIKTIENILANSLMREWWK